MEYLKILKPKTRPIQLEPWFFKYLSGGQLKVLSAIIAHADYRNRKDNSFASNKTIAFYGGFGNIAEGTKEYEQYISLSEEEQKIYKNKKIKNAVQTVKNIKKQLEDLGVITREIIGSKSYAIVDLQWGEERYIREFDEFFNEKVEDKKQVEPTENELIQKLEQLTKQASDGNVSKENLLQQIAALTASIEKQTDETTTKQDTVTDDELDNIVDYIMSSKKIQEKITSGKIKNAKGYRTTIKQQVRDNKFNGIEKIYEKF